MQFLFYNHFFFLKKRTQPNIESIQINNTKKNVKPDVELNGIFAFIPNSCDINVAGIRTADTIAKSLHNII